ncbi:MAG: sigma-54-dependent Fis family transcriptional regulator [Planctomycetes bacterium]|nr:sigma-54-dependent Fis family transcriptional regulator [Planctomycetota bacterium]
MNAKAAILVVDDEEGARVSITRALEPLGYAVHSVPSAEECLAFLKRENVDVVLCDVRLDGMDGLDLQKRIHAEYPDIPVVMITAYAAIETAVRALKQGAYDYISKPFSAEEVRGAIRRALESRRLRLENDSLRGVVQDAQEEIWIGESAASRRLYEQSAQVADSKATVFISGESGTGKEILARHLHAHSPRRGQVFVAVNCASLPENLADSQLFGHVRGAFTGAVSNQRGYLEMASGGTLFLDELSELKTEVQAKLLRALDEHKVRRLGCERETAVDVRILAAAQDVPERLVEKGKLRADLFFRLGAIQLRVPPLRERTQDIPGLALHFLRRFSRELKKPIGGLETESLSCLQDYPWPGNVRELKNAMERAAIFVQPGGLVGPSDLPEKVRVATGPGHVSFQVHSPLSLKEVSRLYTEHVLSLCKGNQTQAAKILEVAPSTLWRRRTESAPPQ